MADVFLVKLSSDECHRILLMIREHWFKQWPGAVRHQAITWANVDPDPYRHMASLWHTELTCIWHMCATTKYRWIWHNWSQHLHKYDPNDTKRAIKTEHTYHDRNYDPIFHPDSKLFVHWRVVISETPRLSKTSISIEHWSRWNTTLEYFSWGALKHAFVEKSLFLRLALRDTNISVVYFPCVFSSELRHFDGLRGSAVLATYRAAVPSSRTSIDLDHCPRLLYDRFHPPLHHTLLRRVLQSPVRSHQCFLFPHGWVLP